MQSAVTQSEQNLTVAAAPATQPPTGLDTLVQSGEKDALIQTSAPIQPQQPKSPEAYKPSNNMRTTQEAARTTVDAASEPNLAIQEPPIPPNVSETEKTLEQSAPSTRGSHGTQTPQHRPSSPSPPSSQRRSYAKTVSTGLDPRPVIEPLTNGKTINAKETTKDNKETVCKRIIENSTNLTNGHDVPERWNGKETTKNSGNYREFKRVTANGDRETNGFIETKDNGKNNWHNGVNHNSGKDRLMTGREKTIRKEGKENFSRREREVNGYDHHNGKGKDIQQNGLLNGKERMVNGKDRSSTRVKVETPKRPAQVQQQIPDEVTENKSVTLSSSTCDFDTDQGQFRPVEHRRNRAQHNGFVRKYSPQIRAESTDKEVAAEPLQTKENSIEMKPPMPRRDSAHKESDKSSTISELSSPTEFSSGQTTPQDKMRVTQHEETHATELNKSVEKLRDGLDERKPKKTSKKGRKNGAGRRTEVKDVKEEEVFEEPPPLPEFLQLRSDDLMNLDLGDALDHALLRSLRQSEPAISKV